MWSYSAFRKLRKQAYMLIITSGLQYSRLTSHATWQFVRQHGTFKNIAHSPITLRRYRKRLLNRTRENASAKSNQAKNIRLKTKFYMAR